MNNSLGRVHFRYRIPFDRFFVPSPLKELLQSHEFTNAFGPLRSIVADTRQYVDVAAYGKTGNRCLVAVVGQRYAVNVMDEHVLRGNAAIIKCHIPSFVAEFVEVDSWIEDEATEIYPSADYGTHHVHVFRQDRWNIMPLFLSFCAVTVRPDAFPLSR